MKSGYLIGFDVPGAFAGYYQNNEKRIAILSSSHPRFMNNVLHDYFFDCMKIPEYAIKEIRKAPAVTGTGSVFTLF